VFVRLADKIPVLQRCPAWIAYWFMALKWNYFVRILQCLNLFYFSVKRMLWQNCNKEVCCSFKSTGNENYNTAQMCFDLGLKWKPLFSFSGKAKISENLLCENFLFCFCFAKNFCSRDSFREKFPFVFSKIFVTNFRSFSRKSLLKGFVFAKVFAHNFANIFVFSQNEIFEIIFR
jgi:hypothetical protein